MLALREKHGDRELASLEIASDPLGLKILIYATPRTGLEAKFSLQYCAAVTWLDGWPGLDAFSDARAARADVQALLRRVVVREARGAEEEVELVFEDGTRARATRAARARESREPALRSRAAREGARVRRLRRWAPAGAERLIDAVARLESLASARELAACLA